MNPPGPPPNCRSVAPMVEMYSSEMSFILSSISSTSSSVRSSGVPGGKVTSIWRIRSPPVGKKVIGMMAKSPRLPTVIRKTATRVIALWTSAHLRTCVYARCNLVS